MRLKEKSKAGSRELLSAVTELSREEWSISHGIGVYYKDAIVRIMLTRVLIGILFVDGKNETTTI